MSKHDDSKEEKIVEEPVAEVAKTSEEIIRGLEVQAADHLAGWQRARADYENLQREVSRERTEFVKFANSALLLEILPIYDNLKLAFNAIPEEQKSNPWVVGLTHIKKQFQDLLTEQGIEEIKTVGEKFDPTLHEAVETVDGEDDDIIIKELKTGYKLAGRVIQPARVTVSKKNNS